MNHIPKMPKDLYRTKQVGDPVFNERRMQNKKLNKIIDHIDHPPEGGMLVYHRSFKYPEEGPRDDYSVQAAQFAKRVLISWIRFFSFKLLLPAYLILALFPWKYKIKILEKWLTEYLNTASLFLQHYFLEDKWYSRLPRELRIGSKAFLKGLGVSEELSEHFSYAFATVIEYDTAYRYRIKDIMTETTKERMLENPRKEIRYLIKILAERDPKRSYLIQKFNSFATLLVYALWIPRVRKAFSKALDEIKFKELQLNDADRYHMRNISDYNFFGMTAKERDKKWPPEEHLYAEIIGQEIKIVRAVKESA